MRDPNYSDVNTLPSPRIDFAARWEGLILRRVVLSGWANLRWIGSGYVDLFPTIRATSEPAFSFFLTSVTLDQSEADSANLSCFGCYDFDFLLQS